MAGVFGVQPRQGGNAQEPHVCQGWRQGCDFKAQIDAHQASGTIGPKDLLSVMVGANDLWALYAKFPAQSADSLLGEARALGVEFGNQINRLANANGRTILLTVPDLGLSPKALADDKLNAGRAKLLSDLTKAFNIEMRITIINDGRLIGLVDAELETQKMVRFQQFNNAVDAACLTTVAATDCTPKTLTTAATTSDAWKSYMWSTDRLLSPVHMNCWVQRPIPGCFTTPSERAESLRANDHSPVAQRPGFFICGGSAGPGLRRSAPWPKATLPQ